MAERGGRPRPPRSRILPAVASMRCGLPIVLAVVSTVFPGQMASAQESEPSPDANARTSVSTPAVILPASFQSDGCTWWFDGDHKACCVQHDLNYYLATGWRDRRRADQKFCGCIWRTPGWWHKPMAPVMWAGVHVLHHGLRPLLGALHLRRPSR